MLKIETVHDMSDYIDLLRASNKIYIDAKKLRDAATEARYTMQDMYHLAALELQIETDGNRRYLTQEDIIGYLEDIGVDMEKRYRNKKVQGYSLDMNKVINPLIEAGIAVDMLSLYKEYKSFKTYSGFLDKMENRRESEYRAPDGREIFVFDTKIEEKENLRAYYRDLAVVSIPKRYSDIITTPNPEYHIAWCDYPQADWRFAYNLFIRDDTNFEQMCACSDAYEGLARIVEGDKFDEAAFRESRKKYKVDCLKVFYNSRDNKPIPKAMREYFTSRANYAKYLYDLRLLYDFKLPVPCTSYFGYEQLLPEASYPDAFISKGLNTPIQTFTSHVVIETVFGILDKFYELGYTSDDIRVYFVRHDEPLFLFKDTILKDAWIFADCSGIKIDGFSPISLDFHFGDYYQLEDEVLTSKVNQSISANKQMITTYDEVGEIKEYHPVPSVESIYVQCFNMDGVETVEYSKGGYKALIYNYRAGEYIRLHTNVETYEEALHDIALQMLDRLGNPRYLLVKNATADFMDTIGEDGTTLMKVVAKLDSNVVESSYGEE